MIVDNHQHDEIVEPSPCAALITGNHRVHPNCTMTWNTFNGLHNIINKLEATRDRIRAAQGSTSPTMEGEGSLGGPCS